MKYILKKDLPFAKAGTKMLLENTELIIPFNDIYLVGAKNHFSYMVVAHIDDIPTLLSEGWIEEVKPSEWVMNVYDDIGECYAYPNETEAGKFRGNGARVIKVREIIE